MLRYDAAKKFIHFVGGDEAVEDAELRMLVWVTAWNLQKDYPEKYQAWRTKHLIIEGIQHASI